MLGVIVNAVGIIFGSLLGLLLKKGIPQKVEKAVMTAIGLCVIIIGLQGALKGENALIMIFAMVLGTIVGTIIDIDKQVNRFGQFIERKVKRPGQQGGIADGFVSGTLLFCVGAMAIVGSLNAGLQGDNEMLFTKALLDTTSSCMMTVSLGIGMALSGVSVFVYQGAIVLLAGLLQPLLTPAAITEITCVGSIMIAVIGTNMIGITKIKVANFLPALIFAPAFLWLFGLVGMA